MDEKIKLNFFQIASAVILICLTSYIAISVIAYGLDSSSKVQHKLDKLTYYTIIIRNDDGSVYQIDRHHETSPEKAAEIVINDMEASGHTFVDVSFGGDTVSFKRAIRGSHHSHKGVELISRSK